MDSADRARPNRARPAHPRGGPLANARAAAIGLSLLLPLASGGAAGPPGADLDSLLEIALRENPRVRAAHAAFESARERVPQAGALPDPMLNLIVDGTPVRRPSPTEAATRRLGVTQMFPFPGKQAAMRAMASAEAAMAQERFARVGVEVADELSKAYYDLYLLHASIDILVENEASLRAMAETARARYIVGTASQPDLLKANVELALEANRIATLQAEIPAAVARINAILDREPETAIGRPDLPDTAFDASTVEDLERLALERQPMLRMKAQEVERARSARKLAGKAGLPDFTVGLEYMAETDMPDAFSGMLGVSLPIWRGNKVRPALREADLSLASARADREQVENELRFMVRDAWTRCTTARTLTILYRTSVLPQAEESLASSRAAYTTGRTGFLDLLDAQRSLLRARLEQVEAIVDYLKSQADLRLAVGDPAVGRVGHD